MSHLVAEENDVEQNSSCNESSKSRAPPAMFLHLRELFFLLALVLTSYTALFNSMPKVGKPPAPVPFFQKKSLVKDYYRGTVNCAFQKASEVDLTVVMYYAPWDAESQAARDEFEAAAQFLHDEVYFIAISCWSPNTECKQHLPRIRHFPVIKAYPLNGKGIQYLGPLKAAYLINFVKALMRPLHRVLGPEDIVAMASRYSTFLVGAFSFAGSEEAPGYYNFYSAAMRILEKDPYREIGFAVVTNPAAASSINLGTMPSVRLYVWNGTFDYPEDVVYTDEALMKWILEKRQEVIEWVSPPKVKSQMLSSHITEGPALILFTPRNPLVDVIPMFSMLRAVAQRYYNCDNNTWADSTVGFIEKQNRELRSRMVEVEGSCLEVDRKSMSDVCFNDTNEYEFEYGSSQSPEKLLESWKEHECGILELANEYYRLPHPRVSELDKPVDKLACANNRTLSIIAMDSLSYYQFAEAFGINIQKMKGRTALVIIDKRSESQYVLERPVSRSSLTEFILNHTEGKLGRYLRSSHDTSARTLTRFRYPVRRNNCSHTETEACVPELSSRNFLDFILDDSSASLVFYHTPYCALCRSISHLFLLLSRYLRFFPGLKFARIDGENNDLPWEYTMNMFPALLFFPTFQKSESRIYNNDLPFTIRNLIHFVLANLEPEAKIPAMISLCLSFEKIQNEEEARKCKSKVQRESYENLSQTLKELKRTMSRWKNLPPSSSLVREVRERKKVYFLKLDYFKNVHFLLGSVDRLGRGSRVVSDAMKLYQKLVSVARGDSFYLNYSGIR